MRSNEDFEDIVKKDLDVRASNGTYDRLRDVVLDAHGRSPTNTSATTLTVTRRTFMKNPLFKLAAAAVLVSAVMLGMYALTGSVDGASITLAQVRQAMENVDWMQVKDKVQNVTAWLSFASKIQVAISPEGKILFGDFNAGKQLIWTPGSQDIYESPLDKEKPFAGGVSGPFELVTRMFSFFTEESGWNTTKEMGNYQGRKVEAWTARRAAETPGTTQMCIVYIDAERKLPLGSTTAIQRADGSVETREQVEWSYPESGPIDIYAAGAPRSAQIKPAPPQEGSGAPASPQ